MRGLGTIVNMAAIIAGGMLGMICGGKLSDRFQKILMQANGLAVLFIGFSGAMAGMLVYSDGSLTTTRSMMVIASLSIGGLIGEAVDIEGWMERFGTWLKKKAGAESDGGFVNAFLTATLTVCIGAMAIVGAIQDGISADHAVLFAKAVLDFVIIMVMSASLGKGCIFSAIPVGILQGGVSLLAVYLSPMFTEAAMADLSCVGSILIFGVGYNLTFGNKIKVGNLLPSLIIAVVWSFLPF